MRKNPVVLKASRGAAALALPGLAVVLALAVAGCGRNGGDVPAGFTPTGVYGEDNVLVVEVVQDTVDGNPIPRVQAQVYDRTSADGYRLYRKVGSSGFDTANDYVGEFVGTYNEGYETYATTDRTWQPGEPCTYLARGTAQGKESALSPISNYALVPTGTAADLLAGDLQLTCPIDTMATDSLPLMVWEPVPGATRYLVKIWRTDNRVFLLGLTLPSGETHYQLASGAGTILQEVGLSESTFFWTVAAIDADWRIIARSQRQIFRCAPSEARPPCTP